MMRTKTKNGKYEFRIRTTSYDRNEIRKNGKKSEFCKRFRHRQASALVSEYLVFQFQKHHNQYELQYWISSHKFQNIQCNQ